MNRRCQRHACEDIGVAQHRPLRPPRRSRGKAECKEVIRIDGDRRKGIGGEELRPGSIIALHNFHNHIWRLARSRHDRRRFCRCCNQGLRFGIGQDEGDLIGGKQEICRNHHRAKPGNCVVGNDPFAAVGQVEHNPVTPPDRLAAQMARQTRGLACKCFK